MYNKTVVDRLVAYIEKLNGIGDKNKLADAGLFWSGACLGAFGFSPVVITGLFALFKYDKQTKISLIVMAMIYIYAGLELL